MFAKGQPVAPYNTTQFLMDDHDQEEPDLKTGLYSKRAAAKSDDTSDDDFMEEGGEEDGGSDGMGGDGSEFLQRDFSETYERYHTESLQNMSKQELIKEYLSWRSASRAWRTRTTGCGWRASGWAATTRVCGSWSWSWTGCAPRTSSC